ncbi:hypothetical protein SAMN06297387_10151 [Streptomyces zhaozhouensis]|uniref:Uncharacterized protein n=1 Tax=Streptomyces zhaozhouensis TaxID=1300267 RepID=A0A286DHX7_9ACTN|nr:hypothetical protein [Streptomyces zhaozhouensis]SOD58241.1 hypothetical protein SAMN06297387_10151 [Streptomyces zhaozhouensis]
MADREETRELLRAAAAEHRPDRERMRARVARGMAARGPAAVAPRRRRGRLVAGAVGAVGCVLAVTVLAGGWLGGDERGGATAASPSARGTLATSGEIYRDDNPYWSQSEVTLETSHPLSALTVEVRVVADEEARPTGGWRTPPEEDFVFTTGEEGGDLVFRWELREGREVPEGEHVFAAQYDHGEGPRDAAFDRYLVTGEGPGGAVEGGGGFS